jgi:hypothetical protein
MAFHQSPPGIPAARAINGPARRDIKGARRGAESLGQTSILLGAADLHTVVGRRITCRKGLIGSFVYRIPMARPIAHRFRSCEAASLVRISIARFRIKCCLS